MTCLQCGAAFPEHDNGGHIASISGSIMGDEYTDLYYLCDHCGAYTVETVYEPFLGDEQLTVKGPVPRTEGDAKVALIVQCQQPWDKKCRCAFHRAYFGDSLD